MTRLRASILGIIGTSALLFLLATSYPHILAASSARTAVFPMVPMPQVLTADALLPLASEMLRRAGPSPEPWSPRAANGAESTDYFFHRRDAHRGVFYFTNATRQTRIISFALESGQLRASCRIAL